ncbi:MAG: hypothetical protein LQ338_003101 [Usnochroma carphineum]|nr:MAG: hypothetical protein LQ338_003101 [Usnochroma carphineum]
MASVLTEKPTSCDHAAGQCVYSLWPPINPNSVVLEYGLDLQHREYEANLKEMKEKIERQQAEAAVSENETEVDPEEQEDFMNSLRSPQHRHCSWWTPEYEARRQARKGLWSPPHTPDPGHRQLYSLQPSQRPPPPPRSPTRRPKPSKLPVEKPQPSQLEQPHPAQHKVRKNKRVATSRRPTTRSMESSQPVSLHGRKGHVITWSAKDGQVVTSFNDYVQTLNRR